MQAQYLIYSISFMHKIFHKEAYFFVRCQMPVYTQDWKNIFVASEGIECKTGNPAKVSKHFYLQERSFAIEAIRSSKLRIQWGCAS